MNQDYAAALEANLQALWIHRELGHRRAEAGDAGNIAHVYRGMGDLDSAIRWNEEAIQIDRELEDKLGEGFRLNSMASIHRERGDLKLRCLCTSEAWRLRSSSGPRTCR